MNINSWKIPEKELGKYFKDAPRVVTRFPPEPSGYLHLGHIKALCINYVLAKRYKGKVLLRFDDTNPKNETQEYEDSILQDIKTLGIDFDNISRTSDHFDIIMEYATNLVCNGSAYVDMSTPEEIKESRKTGIETKYRNTESNNNLELWKSMIEGKCNGVLRIKLNMQHKNNTLRDPTIFRVINETHYRTNNKYLVYPSYDFSCPIVDYLEGVTHVLRSTEFADRDVQYQSILDKIGLTKPLMFSYGKVNIEDALMSKRKIKEGIVNGALTGWDDIKLYTIRSLLRQGLTLEGLFEFVATLGFSKNTVNMKPNKLWAMNRKYIDKIAMRINGVTNLDNLITIEDLEQELTVPKYSKNEALGDRTLTLTNEIFIDTEDMPTINESKINNTNFGLALVVGVALQWNNEHNKFQSDNKQNSNKKVNWVPKNCVEISIINTMGPQSNLVEGETRKWYVEPCISNVAKGSIIQICRAGYYVRDCNNDNLFIEISVGK
jgi:glutamyl-tRNA synthetase